MKPRKQTHRRCSTYRMLGLCLVLSSAMCALSENAFTQRHLHTEDALPTEMPTAHHLEQTDSLIKDAVPIASNQPLFIVNQQEMSPEVIPALNPEYIQHIEILKDASSTAIYGTRGINGVVVITLKTEEQVREEKATKKIEQLLKTKGVDKRNVRYYVDGKEVSAKEACHTSIAQMEIKTGVDGKTEVYIQSIVFIKGEYE